jgi:CheY-like chemotaxis protein/tetratricopeptide (TPR) repeat protein
MRLTEDTLKQLADPDLTPDERALRRCRVAATLIHTGQYEAARDALGDLWQGIGDNPELKGLKPLTAAEVLLQCGVLSGWLGSVRQIPDAQEKAKDLLTEAQRRFQAQGQTAKIAEVYYELGKCYFRLGAYDDARVILDEAILALNERSPELKAKVFIRRASVEIWLGRYHDAWDVLEQARKFFENSGDAIKGRWHGQMALVLQRLAITERRTDYADRAIVEFTAAIYHFEQAGHERYSAYHLNNLAMLLYTLGRYKEAHENLDRAVSLFERLNDEGCLAQVNETRARVLVAEGKYKEAGRVIAGVIKTFERGGEHALLADALTIQGVALARTGQHERSINVLRRALIIAQDSGASSNAAHAALALLEEHGAARRLSDYDLYHTYRRADELLRDTQDAEDIARLRACARVVTRKLSGAHLGERDFSLRKAVLAYESRFIEQALRDADGRVTRAARMLGLGYQSFVEILKGRHKKLQHLRTPPLSRKQKDERENAETCAPGGADTHEATHTLSILVVEDHPVVADAVKETLELEGWSVRLCSNGASARAALEGDEQFDLMIFDYDLPGGLNGIELIRITRGLGRRRRTPIIMLSASDVETEAWRAGTDAFLRKPQDIGRLTEMAARLLFKTE